MITVIIQPPPRVGIKGTETIAGSAYRLVHDAMPGAFGTSLCVGSIYIRTYSDQMLNLSKTGHRQANPEDRYVEVDLDIIVKEKS